MQFNPKTSNPKTSNPKTSNPKTFNPKTSNPKTFNPKTFNPKTFNPKTSNPKTSNPKTSNPKTSKPKTFKPKTSNPKTSKPKTFKPKTFKPKTFNPKTFKSRPIIKFINKKKDPYFYESAEMQKNRSGFFWPFFFSVQSDYVTRQRILKNQISDNYYLTPDYISRKLINCMTKNGKKSISYRIFFKVLAVLKKKGLYEDNSSRNYLTKAILRLRPFVSFKKIIVSGITRKVPTIISIRSSVSVALTWFVKCARVRAEKTMVERLVQECIALNSNSQCGSQKKKIEHHRLAQVNRYLIRRSVVKKFLEIFLILVCC